MCQRQKLDRDPVYMQAKGFSPQPFFTVSTNCQIFKIRQLKKGILPYSGVQNTDSIVLYFHRTIGKSMLIEFSQFWGIIVIIYNFPQTTTAPYDVRNSPYLPRFTIS